MSYHSFTSYATLIVHAANRYVSIHLISRFYEARITIITDLHTPVFFSYNFTQVAKHGPAASVIPVLIPDQLLCSNLLVFSHL